MAATRGWEWIEIGEEDDCAYQKEITAHKKRAMSQFICDMLPETEPQFQVFLHPILPFFSPCLRR